MFHVSISPYHLHMFVYKYLFLVLQVIIYEFFLTVRRAREVFVTAFISSSSSSSPSAFFCLFVFSLVSI